MRGFIIGVVIFIVVMAVLMVVVYKFTRRTYKKDADRFIEKMNQYRSDGRK